MLPGEKRRLAYEARQKDGWKQAAAHYIPFYWAYYAVSRRTITPSLYQLGAEFIVAIITAMLLIWGGLITDQEAKSLFEEPLILVWISVTTLMGLMGTKLGIDRAREAARMALKTEDQSPAD
ncbi:MAG TPA: hypothetical protein DD643_03970 [Synechococcus sp. UBA8638]|uniref:hypothetical protein n=1 Tax=Candidatus Synechococcus spongiarum TaxID=431041 RepID=UPI0004711F8A|nr:hypothetical protein [Candidatus Synechococcus spongiarum]HBP53541.1 hypothetical protein [Synechococcus sp. UBA8638]